jgi:dephospho-CoA kinase
MVALTGGIGSGKSSVGRMLASRGAVVVDADVLARAVVEPGTPGLASVVAAFGPQVLAADGRLDRARLAQVVFGDPEARGRLEAIVHPLVEAEAAERFAAAPQGAMLVYEIPLLAETGRGEEFAAVVVVDAPDDVRVSRLVARGMSEREARERMAAQATREQRLAVADLVIVNEGTLSDLEQAVTELLPRLLELAAK